MKDSMHNVRIGVVSGVLFAVGFASTWVFPGFAADPLESQRQALLMQLAVQGDGMGTDFSNLTNCDGSLVFLDAKGVVHKFEDPERPLKYVPLGTHGGVRK